MSENVTIDGTVIVILPVEDVSGGKWQKQEIVVETDEKYPQELKIEFFGEKAMDELIDLQVGNFVQVAINLKGRRWTGQDGVTKWFSTFAGWRLRTIPVNTPAPVPGAQAAHQQGKQDGYAPPPGDDDVNDDIPF